MVGMYVWRGARHLRPMGSEGQLLPSARPLLDVGGGASEPGLVLQVYHVCILNFSSDLY